MGAKDNNESHSPDTAPQGPPDGELAGPEGSGRSRDRAPSPAELALIAAVFSFILPGVGHFLIRAWSRGLIWLIGMFVIGALSSRSQAPIPLILMVIAAIDAYLMARWSEPADEGTREGVGGARRS